MAIQSIHEEIRDIIRGNARQVELPLDLDVLPKKVACQLAGVPNETFRYWVRIGLIENKKSFSLRDAQRIKVIKELIDAGFKPSGLVGKV